ncbi:hypothetical protein AA313_de0202673 [Arthrobotrys entomopaga]|nr:hypothetical protein AA313_de0202673 [Arthrobotrys entomopaga]
METLGNAGDSLMVDYTDVNRIQLSPEDFDIDAWLASFSTLQTPNEQLQAPVDTSSITPPPEISTGFPDFTFGPADVQDYSLTNGQNELMAYIDAFPFTSQEFAGYQLQSQLPLPEVGDVPSLCEPSPPSADLAQEPPEQSEILQRYVNASSEDESEAPFSAIQRHLDHLGSSNPPSPISMDFQTHSYEGFKPNMEYDLTDSSSILSNSSNVSWITRADCLKELGPFPTTEDWSASQQVLSRTPSIRSFRSSSSVASDVGSIRTTSTSSRAPSRRKRTMTNSHKTTRKTPKSDNRFFCTFCGTSFSTKSTWKRHEESIHLMLKTWTCTPHGVMVNLPPKTQGHAGKSEPYRTCWFCTIDKDVSNVPFSFGQNHHLQTARDVPDRYHSMTCFSLEQHCFSHLNARTCHDNTEAEKTFIRFDHFARHLRDAHNVQGLKSSVEGTHESAEDPLFGVFKTLPGPKHSRCGFCGETFSSWSDRVHHVSHEFWWKKRRIEEWSGDWGFDPEWVERLQDARLPEEFCSADGESGGDGDAKMHIDVVQRPSTPASLAVHELVKIKTTLMDRLEVQSTMEGGIVRECSNLSGRFPCTMPGCIKSFCLRKDLQRHIRTIHADKKPEFLCPVPECKRFIHGFTRKDNLKYHIMQLHTNPDSPGFSAMQQILKTL